MKIVSIPLPGNRKSLSRPIRLVLQMSWHFYFKAYC